jgi:hypothetical protein
MRTLRAMQLAMLVGLLTPLLAFVLGRRSGRPADAGARRQRDASFPSCTCHPPAAQAGSTDRRRATADAGEATGMIVQTMRLMRLTAVAVALLALLAPVAFWLGQPPLRPSDTAAARPVPPQVDGPVPSAAPAATTWSGPPASGSAYVFHLQPGAVVVLAPPDSTPAFPVEDPAPALVASVPSAGTPASSASRDAPAPPALATAPDAAASPPPHLPPGAFVVWLPAGSAPSLPSEAEAIVAPQEAAAPAPGHAAAGRSRDTAASAPEEPVPSAPRVLDTREAEPLPALPAASETAAAPPLLDGVVLWPQPSTVKAGSAAARAAPPPDRAALPARTETPAPAPSPAPLDAAPPILRQPQAPTDTLRMREATAPLPDSPAGLPQGATPASTPLAGPATLARPSEPDGVAAPSGPQATAAGTRPTPTMAPAVGLGQGSGSLAAQAPVHAAPMGLVPGNSATSRPPEMQRSAAQNCGGLGSCAWGGLAAGASACTPDARICTSVGTGPLASTITCSATGVLRVCTAPTGAIGTDYSQTTGTINSSPGQTTGSAAGVTPSTSMVSNGAGQGSTVTLNFPQ